MPGAKVETWGDIRSRLSESVPESAADRLEGQLANLESWCKGALDFGIALWKPDYMNVVFVAGNWLHDLEAPAGQLRIGSGPVAGPIPSQVLVSDVWEGPLRVEVGWAGDVRWHWEALDTEARGALMLFTSQLRRHIGAY